MPGSPQPTCNPTYNHLQPTYNRLGPDFQPDDLEASPKGWLEQPETPGRPPRC
jgi:hypothetical protein